MEYPGGKTRYDEECRNHLPVVVDNAVVEAMQGLKYHLTGVASHPCRTGSYDDCLTTKLFFSAV